MSAINPKAQPNDSTAPPHTCAPQSLAAFQHSFGQYLRQPQRNELVETKQSAEASAFIDPTSTAPRFSAQRITKLYHSLVFNNIRSFIDKCFPVCQTLISDSHWQEISEQFFLNNPCHSPYFTQINQSFVDYLSLPDTLDRLNLPPYFAELAHYEWMELWVDIYPDADWNTIAAASKRLQTNPTLQNLHYRWPVHEINAQNQTVSEADSFFLIYRTDSDVPFMQVNAVTHALIDFIAQHQPIQLSQTLSENILLEGFAQHLGFADTQVIIDFGLPLLEQLIEQQVLIITPPSNQNTTTK